MSKVPAPSDIGKKRGGSCPTLVFAQAAAPAPRLHPPRPARAKNAADLSEKMAFEPISTQYEGKLQKEEKKKKEEGEETIASFLTKSRTGSGNRKFAGL